MRSLALAVVLLSLTASCTAPEPLPTISSLRFGTETRPVAIGTRGVEVDGPIDVTLAIGPTPSLVLEANDNLLPRITSETRDGVLHLDMRGWTMGVTRLKATLTLPQAQMISVRGVGNIDATGFAGGPLDIVISGAGHVRVAGMAERLTVTVSGVGGVNADALAVQDATVMTSGAGNVKLQVARTLGVTHSGIGSVVYRGTPQVTASGNGIGEVRAARS
ncbi:head GIN domain-containing protein [Roseiterribacter gracilis]|uniref:Putative auto-transporter adhesin head GIN domain-containing protein n=1 Tax=Roseiterribacter gracilis TaxID=2812848 RepID=A0A8S8XB41_9PROT|nr:hypothetical protein TMPK1_06130 [Rhodospirillales bacterium TMPK1]